MCRWYFVDFGEVQGVFGTIQTPEGEGGALMLVWCSLNFVSGISVGIALCVLPE